MASPLYIKGQGSDHYLSSNQQKRDKNMRKIVILLIALSTLVISCVDANKIEVRGLDGVKIGRISATGIDAVASVSIRNDNQTSINMKGLDATILLEGAPLGYIKTLAPIELKGQFDGVLEIPFNIRIGQLGFTQIAMIAASEGTYQIKGEVSVGAGGIGSKFKFDEKITAAQVRQLLNI